MDYLQGLKFSVVTVAESISSFDPGLVLVIVPENMGLGPQGETVPASH